MSDFQQRTIDEKTELDLKLNRLTQFVDGSVFPTIDPKQQSLLRQQLQVMIAYSAILAERIVLF